MKKKILFIINPTSGTTYKNNIEVQIKKRIDSSHFDFEVRKTQYKGEGFILAQEAVTNQFDIVVAVGGDGTINEVASALIDSPVILGIIPIGSGNGLARHLLIPMGFNKAIELLNTYNEQVELIDVGKVNEHYFFSIAGIGYDAKVAYDFNQGKKRGFKGYFKHIVKNYFDYNSDTYIIHYEGRKIERRAFFITFANSSQWGYNIKIQPSASLKDGKFNMLICKKPNLIKVGYGIIELFLGRIEQSRLIEILLFNKVKIFSKNNKPMHLHIDGDAVAPVNVIDIELLPTKLKVISGAKK